MPIVEADIDQRLSGGSANTDPNNSTGGAISTVGGGVIVSDADNNDMDDITSTEATNGIVIYHAYFYQNNHGSLTFTLPVFWIETQTSSGDTDVEIAIATEAKNLAVEVLPDEETAPGFGVSFTAPANKAAGIAIGSLDPTDFRGHWIKYTVTAGASSAIDQYTIKSEGDTLP